MSESLLGKESSMDSDDGRFLFPYCERCIETLGKLLQVHVTMDYPQRSVTEADPEAILRLRKVAHHVRAVTSFDLGEYASHVMGPEIRAALEQLYPVGMGIMFDGQPVDGATTPPKNFSRWEKELVQFSHPTRVGLAFHERFGGLWKDDSIGYWGQLTGLLAALAVNYGLGLCVVAGYLDPSKEPEILDLVNQSWSTLPGVAGQDDT